MVVKLLGLNLSYNLLYNRIFSLLKCSQQFCLMDVENGYFLVKFQITRKCLLRGRGSFFVVSHDLVVDSKL